MGGTKNARSTVDFDGLRDILRILGKNFDEFTAVEPGVPGHVQDKGMVTAQELGGSSNFPAGNQLGEATQKAYSLFSSEYRTFVQGYGDLLKRLERAVQGHENKEDSNKASADGIRVDHHTTTQNRDGGRRNNSNMSAW